jgi:hypothetical protein
LGFGVWGSVFGVWGSGFSRTFCVGEEKADKVAYRLSHIVDNMATDIYPASYPKP